MRLQTSQSQETHTTLMKINYGLNFKIILEMSIGKELDKIITTLLRPVIDDKIFKCQTYPKMWFRDYLNTTQKSE